MTYPITEEYIRALLAKSSGEVSLNGKRITNVAPAETPTDAITKAYADSAVSTAVTGAVKFTGTAPVTDTLPVYSNTTGLQIKASTHPVDPTTGALLGPMFTVPSIKTTGYTAVVGELVRVDTSAGAVAITLPTAVGNAGRRISVKKVAGAVNAVTFLTTSSQTIDSIAQAGFTAAGLLIAGVATLGNTYIEFMSDGANWIVCG